MRLIEADGHRARQLADALPGARVYHATGFDREFLRRERIGRATAAVFAMREDAQNLYAAILAKNHGVPFTIAVLEQPGSADVFDSAGVDAAIDPGAETAEVMVRFAHDPRTHTGHVHRVWCTPSEHGFPAAAEWTLRPMGGTAGARHHVISR